MQTEILEIVVKEVEAGRKAALVFLTEAKGSIPGAHDSLMAVLADGRTFGTIGGGAVEFEVIKKALRAIEEGRDENFSFRLTQNSETKMLCGGNSSGYIKVFKPRPQLIIFGAGHVSQKLARIAVKTDFDVTVVDEREDFKDKEDFEGIKKFLSGSKEEAVASLNFDRDNTYIVICTTSTDFEALRLVLGRDFKYLGMIGSRAKVSLVKKKILEEGFTEEDFARVHAPVGLDIDNGRVEEIAISIMAQILAVKNSKEEAL